MADNIFKVYHNLAVPFKAQDLTVSERLYVLMLREFTTHVPTRTV